MPLQVGIRGIVQPLAVGEGGEGRGGPKIIEVKDKEIRPNINQIG